MIRYALKCAAGHGFESWFASADAYDKLAQAGMISCSLCGSTDVEKTLMAPALGQGSKKRAAPARGVDAAPSRAPQVAGTDAMSREAQLETALAKLRQEVEANSSYVGGNFAKEARAMHEGTAPERAIYGEAKPEEARKLLEDGVPVMPLPFIPKRKTN